MISTSKLLNTLRNSLQSGMFPEGDEVVYVPNPVFRVLNCCSMFERHFYKNIGKVSSDHFWMFYDNLHTFVVSIPLDKFRENAQELSPEQKDVVLRGFGKVQEQCQCEDLVEYILILTEGLKEL